MIKKFHKERMLSPCESYGQGMKKIIILFLLTTMLLVGCNNPDFFGSTQNSGNAGDTTQDSGNADDATQGSGNVDDTAQNPGGTENESGSTDTSETSLKSFDYATGDLESVIFTDVKKGISIDLSANGVLKSGLMSAKYNSDEKQINVGEAIYELKIDGKSLFVYSENVVSYNGSDKYPCREFDVLAYLDGLIVGDAVQLNGYAADASVNVKNNVGAVAKIDDKAEFFAELAKVKTVKLARVADYTISEATYKITIGDQTIEICGGYLKIGEDLYAVIEGNFDFLSSYTFASSSGGFLPWI